ncbi:MAG: zinc-ribbon domain containing protein [Patescibacteria group bacterium]
MAFQDQTLTCRDCGNPFTWTASEQEFYQSKGFQNSPVRCPSCRQAKKARMDGGGGRGGPRQTYEITCSNCGKKDMVPFQPRGDRPVLCGDCFRKQRDNGGVSQPEAQSEAQPAAEPESQPQE